MIGATAGVLAALQRPAQKVADVAWIATASMTLDLSVRLLELLNAARRLPDANISVIDAGWQRSSKLRLPQNMAKVCAHSYDSECYEL